MVTPANNIEKLSDVFSQEVQELEDAILQILTDTILTTAVGVQLDGLGEVIGLERQGLDDATYRARLRSQILANKSNGTINELIAIADLFTGGGETFTLVESFTGFDIEFTTILPFGIGEQLAKLIRRARSAAVNGHVTFHQSTPIFAFDGFGGAQFDYTDADTNVGFGLSGSLGSNATLDSSVTDLTAELSLNDVFSLSGFGTSSNDGKYRVTSAPAASSVGVKKLAGTPTDEAAGASVTMETDGFGMRTSLG